MPWAISRRSDAENLSNYFTKLEKRGVSVSSFIYNITRIYDSSLIVIEDGCGGGSVHADIYQLKGQRKGRVSVGIKP